MSSTDEDESSTDEDGSSTDEDGRAREVGPDEVYCTSCGEVIKEAAEICPECGVRQKEQEDTITRETGASIPDGRVYELQKVARKSPGVAVALGLLLTPAAYWYVDRIGLALVNFLTFNYLLLGFIVVPIHSYKIIMDAREELKRHGEGW